MKTEGILTWSSRILAILAILFISLFALDSFDPELSPGDQILGFIIHMIPSFLLAGILWLAWKQPRLGGLIFISIGLVASPFLFWMNYGNNHSIAMSISTVLLIPVPLMITGVLFFLSARKDPQTN